MISSLSIIIPIFNEEKRILESLFKIRFFLNKIKKKIKMYDTQCGYKLYKNKIAKKIFKKLKTNKFEHDLEIILNAKQFNYFIKELPVKWTHKPNSKLNIFTDSSKMLYGIILLSLRKKIRANNMFLQILKIIINKKIKIRRFYN